MTESTCTHAFMIHENHSLSQLCELSKQASCADL
jgi:solute carrier family 24 (sodium/potassium/calcium exchanger), member 6